MRKWCRNEATIAPRVNARPGDDKRGFAPKMLDIIVSCSQPQTITRISSDIARGRSTPLIALMITSRVDVSLHDVAERGSSASTVQQKQRNFPSPSHRKKQSFPFTRPPPKGIPQKPRITAVYTLPHKLSFLPAGSSPLITLTMTNRQLSLSCLVRMGASQPLKHQELGTGNMAPPRITRNRFSVEG